MAPKKKPIALVKLQLPAGKATPAPPVGPALGPHGVSGPQFVQQFNDRTKNMEVGLIIPVVVSIYADRTFSFILKTPPASVLIKRALGLSKGSSIPNREKVGQLNAEQVQEIATIKMPDLNTKKLESAMRMIKGTARAMGVEVKQ